jgi:hypothetical protein
MSTSKPVCVSASVIQQLRAALRPASEHNTVSVTLEDVSRRTLQELWQALESSSLTKSGGQSVWRFVVQNNQTSNKNCENGTFSLDRLPPQPPPQITVVERTTTNNGAATSPCESGASSTHFQTSVSVRSEIVHFPIRTRVGHLVDSTNNNNNTDTNRAISTNTNRDNNTVSDLDLANVRVHLCFTTRNDELGPPTFMHTTQADSNVKSQTDTTTIQDAAIQSTAIQSTANQDAAIQSTAIHTPRTNTPQLVVRRQFAHTYTYTNKRGYEYVISVATCSDLDLEQAEPHETQRGSRSNTSNTSNTSIDGLESALHDTRQQTRQLSIRYRINPQEAQTQENDKNAPSTSKSKPKSKPKSLLYHSLHCMNLLVQCVRGELNMTLDTWDTEA